MRDLTSLITRARYMANTIRDDRIQGIDTPTDVIERLQRVIEQMQDRVDEVNNSIQEMINRVEH